MRGKHPNWAHKRPVIPQGQGEGEGEGEGAIAPELKLIEPGSYRSLDAIEQRLALAEQNGNPARAERDSSTPETAIEERAIAQGSASDLLLPGEDLEPSNASSEPEIEATEEKNIRSYG